MREKPFLVQKEYGNYMNGTSFLLAAHLKWAAGKDNGVAATSLPTY